jgi:hypothetical protein
VRQIRTKGPELGHHPLPGLPHHERDRPAHARPSPRRGCDQPHSVAVVSLVPAERAIRRARAAIADQHRRRHARGVSSADGWRLAQSVGHSNMEETHIVDAWLANKELERLEDYLKRSRPLAGVPLEELRERWIAQMRNWAESVSGFDHREHEDIEAEMKLRRVQPPVDLAKDALETIYRKSKEITDELLKDPVSIARTEQKLSAEIAKFEATAKGTKN